ncbi:transglutaminase-like protein [Clostridiales bacterium oral taxon 876 str. F0540]|nr:transglutaminase-like protein [Clostridiales bacterium oral taxon 876 str. F0540]
MKKRLGNIIISITKALLNYTFEAMLFLFILLMSKVIQEAYLIKDFNFWVIIALFFIGLLLFALSNWLYKSTKKNIYGFIFVIIVLILIILSAVFKFSSLKTNYEIIQRNFYFSKETYLYQHIPFLTVIIPIFIVLMLYLNKKGLGNILILANFLLLLCLNPSIEIIKMKKFILLSIVLSMSVYGVDKFILSSNKLSKEGIKNSASKIKIYQYVILTSLFACVFSYAAVQILGVKSAKAVLGEYLSINKNQKVKSINNKYDLSYSGYSKENNKLGGAINLDYSLAFKVKAEETYYLKGTVKDYYDGFKWSNTSENYERKAEGTNLRYASDNFKKYLQGDTELKSITVYPENLVTSTIFSPSFPCKVLLSKGYLGADNTGSFIVLGNTSIDKPYTVNFYKSKEDIELFSNSYKSNVSLNYDENTKRQYKKYLEVPENILPEVYELVEDITKNCSSNSEKIESIRNYLSKNYKYSLDVSDVPENREFVDYFLFTEKKGYCTYFATAETIMCRIAGIPSRYVEGFKMTNKKDLKGIYEVTNDMAHAWTEVLLYPDEDIWSIVDSTVEAQREEYKGAQLNKSDKPASINNKSKTYGKSKNYGTLNIEVTNLIDYIIGLMFICTILILVFAIYKISAFIMYKNNILKSNNTAKLYNYVKHRLSFVLENVYEDDLLWTRELEEEALKEKIKILVDAAYEEFYGKRKTVNINKLKIYIFIEKYIRKKQNWFKYYFIKFLKYKPKA